MIGTQKSHGKEPYCLPIALSTVYTEEVERTEEENMLALRTLIERTAQR